MIANRVTEKGFSAQYAGSSGMLAHPDTAGACKYGTRHPVSTLTR